MIDKVETLITYKSDSEADVKLFLVHADSKDRLCSIPESKLVDPLLASVSPKIKSQSIKFSRAITSQSLATCTTR